MSEAPNLSFTSVPYVLRVVLARPAFWGAWLVGGVVAWIVPAPELQPWVAKAIWGWNAGAAVFLLAAALQIFGKPRTSARVLAVLQQDGRQLVLALAWAAVLLCLGAVVAELALARELGGPQRLAHTALAGLTLLSAWAVCQVVAALHYAQAYFYAQVQGSAAVLSWTAERQTDYRRFLAFALALGTLGRSGGARLTSPALQRLALGQRVLAVLFNLTLLVVLINLAAGLA
jgi:uncharacterized membrane protein